jgi:predicted TPR repeat methyltransferase
MAEKTPIQPQLWTERPVEETIAVYRDWAASYDDDLAKRGYQTPMRIAQALLPFRDQITGPILDFGCGTGLSGLALKAAGFGPLHGVDITAEMLALAESKAVYDKLWLGTPGTVPAQPGDYGLIVAAGVISLGAAPPETLGQCLDALAPGALLALSFNDPTLEAGTFDAALLEQVTQGRAEVLVREHGPHLDDIGMGSDVMVLRRL